MKKSKIINEIFINHPHILDFKYQDDIKNLLYRKLNNLSKNELEELLKEAKNFR